MSLEQNIVDLIAALNANTAALTGAAPVTKATATPEKAATTKTTKTTAKAKSKFTEAEVKAAAVKLVDAKGRPFAKEIIGEFAKELAAIKEEQYDAFIARVEEALADEGEGEEDDGTGGL